MNINLFKQQIKSLSLVEKQELINLLKNSYSIFDTKSNISNCPYCNTTKIVKNGTRNGINRYKCKECTRSFTYKTNTPIHYIHKLNKWNDFVSDFTSLNFSSLDKISDVLKINKKTAFDWRHKLLSALITDDINFKNEEIEFDEVVCKLSRKGCTNLNLKPELKNTYRRWRRGQRGDSNYNVKLFFSIGRNSKNIDITQSHMGRTSTDDMVNYFTTSKFNNVVVLSDSHQTYQSFFKSKNIEQYVFVANDHVHPTNRNVHNQTVNAYAKNFKEMINGHFKGVSTKYISFYAKWFQFLCNAKSQMSKITSKVDKIEDIICDKVVSSTNGLEMYRQSEFALKSFLKANNRTLFGHTKNHYYANVA